MQNSTIFRRTEKPKTTSSNGKTPDVRQAEIDAAIAQFKKDGGKIEKVKSVFEGSPKARIGDNQSLV